MPSLRYRYLLLIFCCYSLISSPLLLAGVALNARVSPAEETLLDVESSRFKAQIAGDTAALKHALADELLYTHASGRVQNKDEYLQGFLSGAVHYQAIDVVDHVVHVNGNMGMTSGLITLTVGNDMQLVSRYTGVYVLRDGRWQLLAWQTTDIRPPAK